MAYAYQQKSAIAGQIGLGNLATAKTTAEEYKGEAAIQAGRFVSIDATGGVKPAIATAPLAGVVIYSAIKDAWATNELLDVMHITAGDGVWVKIADGKTMARGDAVKVVATTGEIAKDGAIATNFHVLAVSGDLALITKL